MGQKAQGEVMFWPNLGTGGQFFTHLAKLLASHGIFFNEFIYQSGVQEFVDPFNGKNIFLVHLGWSGGGGL